MSSQFKVRFAQIEREHVKLLLEQVRWASEHKLRKPIKEHCDHFVDLRYILKWIENPDDDRYGERVLCLLPGIESSTACQLLQVSKNERELFPSSLALPVQAQSAWSGLVEIAAKVKAHPRRWPEPYYLIRDWYIPLMRLRYDDALGRAEDIGVIERFPSFRSRQEFLSDCLAPRAEHLVL
jgi:hypothetical protein